MSMEKIQFDYPSAALAPIGGEKRRPMESGRSSRVKFGEKPAARSRSYLNYANNRSDTSLTGADGVLCSGVISSV